MLSLPLDSSVATVRMWTLADRADRAERRMDVRLLPNKPRSSTAPGAVAVTRKQRSWEAKPTSVITVCPSVGINYSDSNNWNQIWHTYGDRPANGHLGKNLPNDTPGAKTINVFRACLTICAQKWRNFVLFSTVSFRFILSRVCVFLYSLGPLGSILGVFKFQNSGLWMQPVPASHRIMAKFLAPFSVTSQWWNTQIKMAFFGHACRNNKCNLVKTCILRMPGGGGRRRCPRIHR